MRGMKDKGGSEMRGPGKSPLLKGFENESFRRALFSFLREKCPEDFDGDEDAFNMKAGLQRIREFISGRRDGRRPCPVPIAG